MKTTNKTPEEIAKIKEVTTTQIMLWYERADGIKESIEIVEIMDARIKQERAKGFDEGFETCKKLKDELLKLLKKAQLSVEILINHIPTGRMRNILTEENIEILTLIEKTEKK